MKATELRIGNWVNINGWDCDVAEISTNQIQISNGIEPYLLEYEVEPIPLTEEWLVKFGFEFDGHCSFWKSDIELTKETWEENYSVFNANGNYLTVDGIIKHVHQLQNLYFALTGEELTINQ